MGSLTVVGLGPGDPGHLTVRARDLLVATPSLIVSTVEHPVVRWIESLGHEVIVLESVLNPLVQRSVQSLSAVVVEHVRQRESTLLATPGNPLFDNLLVRSVVHNAELSRIGVNIISGVSFLDASLLLCSWLPRTTLQILSPPGFWPKATIDESLEVDLLDDPFREIYRNIDPTQPAFVGPIFHVEQLRYVRKWLASEYEVDHQVQAVTFGRDDGTGRAVTVSLANLEWDSSWSSLCLLLEPIERLSNLASVDTLRYIVARLRRPNGCPWDREQDYNSIKKHLIEETYEAIAALEEQDFPRFAEELGDVLLQVVMYAQFGHETGDFAFKDVLHAVNEKLIRRHPHVFGDVVVSTSAEVLRNWETIKRTERNGRGSIFGGIPESAPALMRADAIQSRATRLGWVESANISLAVDLENREPEHRAVDLGTLLFDVVALARRNKIDPEAALRLATNRFLDAVDTTLAAAQADGSQLEGRTIEEQWRRTDKRFGSDSAGVGKPLAIRANTDG